MIQQLLLALTIISTLIAFRYKYLYEKIKRIDFLTGLGNGLAFKSDLEQIIKNHSESTPFSIIIVDIDNFKALNSQLGYAKADKVLVEIANIIISGKSNMNAYRQYLKGDEFLIICPKMDIYASYQIAEKIRNSVESCLYFENVKITVSCGVTKFNLQEDSFDTLLERLSASLLVAKKGENKNKTITV